MQIFFFMKITMLSRHYFCWCVACTPWHMGMSKMNRMNSISCRNEYFNAKTITLKIHGMENYLHAFERVLPHSEWTGVVRFECRRQRTMMNFPSVQLLRIVHAPDLKRHTQRAKNETELEKEAKHRRAPSSIRTLSLSFFLTHTKRNCVCMHEM